MVLQLDSLEPRTLLSNVSWTGQGDGTTWTQASNWSNDAVPTASDDVTINLSGNPTIQITTGSQSVHSLTSTDPLSISGGSLSVAASSTISGGLTMTGGSLAASGSGVSLTVTGTTTDSGGSLYAEAGASLSLAQLTGYAGSSATTTLEATGAGSTLTLANLASLTQSANNYQAQTQIEALAGGTVTVSALKTINTGTVILEADGASSVLNVSALTGFTEANGWTTSTLQASNSGTVEDSSLASLSNVNLNVAGPGENLTLTPLTSFASGQYHRQRRGKLSLPGITGYTGNGGHHHAGGDRHGQHPDPGQPHRRDPVRQQLPGPGPVRGPGRRHGDRLGSQDHRHGHGGPGERRRQQRAQHLGLDRLHRGQWLDHLDPPGLQQRHGRR